jgi:hypothetical protein
MSSVHIFLSKNIYIVHRLPEKFTKSKRFKEDLVANPKPIKKKAKLRFVVERAVFASRVRS